MKIFEVGVVALSNQDLIFFIDAQKEDLKAVVNHLRSDGSVSFIGLWGRSMGAVTRSS
jgi:dienelactone hydrolase